MVDGNFLINFRGGVERAGERRVFNNRHLIVVRRVAHAQRQRIDAFSDTDGRAVALFVIFQRDRIVGRVHNQHCGVSDGDHHPAARDRLTLSAQPRTDLRIAFRFLLLATHFFLGHAQTLSPGVTLIADVQSGDH